MQMKCIALTCHYGHVCVLLPMICTGFRGRPCARSWVTEKKMIILWIRDAALGESSGKIVKNSFCVLLYIYSFLMYF